MKPILPLIFLLLPCALAAELPVREVILFKHGVGFFQREGRLGPGETARLDFKASEMNDVLKSLTVDNRGGAKITGLRYDSSEPLEQKLSEFPFAVQTENPTLSGFLNQLKGARVELKFGAETIAGLIVSARLSPGDDKRPEREQLVIMLDNGDLRTLDLSAAASLHFSDPALQAKLRDYLRVLEASRSKEKRSVYIDSTDAGERQIVASYMTPTPVWKSSYRLIFADAGQPTLEGWAIVDNTSGEDWDKVTLAVVSGRPISFISRLYEPRYVQRPTAELPEDRATAPVVYEGALADALKEEPAAGLRPFAPAPPPAAKSAMKPMSGRASAITMSSPSLEVNAQGQELGELFEYRFSNPVTVKKGESAMLPFLQQKIGARKLLIYSDTNQQHPMNAAELTNSTGKTLDGGPITVFDGGTYAGEALMETLKTADKRLISYAIDLGTRITTKFNSDSAYVREVHARRGLLTTRFAQDETQTYTIRNVDAKAKTLIVERPVRAGYKIVNQRPSETTPSAYRFEVKLPAGADEKFTVTEEREYDNTIQLVNASPDFLGDYVRNKKITDSARRQLEAISQQKRQIVEATNSLRELETQISSLFRDQERIRQNIQSLNNVSGQQEQVQNYARTLSAQETTLAGLRDRQNELTKKKSQLEADLNTMIDKIDF